MNDLRKAAEMALESLDIIRASCSAGRMVHADNEAKIAEHILRQALEADGGNCYGDGTVYRGQRSKDSAVQTYKAKLKEKNHG